jgi:hypothetical protein
MQSKTKNEKSTIVAKIPKELDKLLIDEAKSTHRSKSGMIAEIIATFFGGKDAEIKS